MKKLVFAALAGVLSLSTFANADRGDRHSPRGDDRYARQRYEASVRYERGSRNYEHTYVRYGQDNYARRPSYDRDYVRRSERGSYYVNGRAQRSNWGFSFGYNTRSGYAGDSVSLGFYYSNRHHAPYRYPGYSYHRAPDVYEYREYRSAPSYYSVRTYDYGHPRYSYSRSYYCR